LKIYKISFQHDTSSTILLKIYTGNEINYCLKKGNKMHSRCHRKAFHFILDFIRTSFEHLIFFQMTFDQIKKFLIELKTNQTLLNEISSVATANEIAIIASHYGFEFTGKELKEISKSKIEGVNIKTQDTTPSYNFGEGGN